MADIRTAQQKYERNTAQAAPRWAAGVQQAGPSSYCEGIARFIGQPVGPCLQQEGANWQAGVQGAQGRYQSGVQGKGSRWAQRYIQRFTQ